MTDTATQRLRQLATNFAWFRRSRRSRNASFHDRTLYAVSVPIDAAATTASVAQTASRSPTDRALHRPLPAAAVARTQRVKPPIEFHMAAAAVAVFFAVHRHSLSSAPPATVFAISERDASGMLSAIRGDGAWAAPASVLGLPAPAVRAAIIRAARLPTARGPVDDPRRRLRVSGQARRRPRPGRRATPRPTAAGRATSRVGSASP